MRKRFLSHQRRAWETIKRSTALALFWEMRLGKTLLVIRWLATRPALERALIVCPLSVIPSWSAELDCEGHDHAKLVGTRKQREQILLDAANRGARFFLINYEALCERGHKTPKGKPKAVASPFARMEWDAVVADESTRIRNPRAQVTKVFLGSLASARYRSVMSGLPNPEGEQDLVCQMAFCHGSFMGCKDYWTWRSRHMQSAGYAWVMRRKSVRRAVAEMHEKSLVLSRKDAGIGSVKMRETRHVALPKKVLAAVATAERDFQVGDRLTSTKLTVLTWIAQLCGGSMDDYEHDAKNREVHELVSGELRREPVIVWARFTKELFRCQEYLRARKTTVGLVYGDMKLHEREQQIRDFKTGKIQVLCCQPKCLQMGVDMSWASTAIYLSNYWDHEVRAQSEDRVIHPQKKEPGLIIDVVAQGTIDEELPKALSVKGMTSRSLLRAVSQKLAERFERAA